MSKKAHNLDINMYSLDEILKLFDISYEITIEDLKRAKKKVLMSHPDKSKLSPEYFLFYKKAFDFVLRFYENQQKTNAEVPKEEQQYEPIKSNELNNATTNKVRKTINEMEKKQFQETFNRLFEENMMQPQDKSKHEWFSKEEPIFQTNEPVNMQNMGNIIEEIKKTQSGLSIYRGVESLFVNPSSGQKIYEDDEEDNGTYLTCDPFSKLKFDDLRKVHKDQTVLAVSEHDINKVKQYSSVDHFIRDRRNHAAEPLNKEEAEQLLENQEKMYREQIMRKEYDANLRTLEYSQKNKAVLSNFLHLTNN